MLSFRDWLQQESSPFTRLRRDAAFGLKPTIPLASLHSRSTASPAEVKAIKKKHKKKKLDEAKVAPIKHVEIDGWLKEVDKLKSTIDSLKDVMKKKPKKDEKPVDEKKPEKGKPDDENENEDEKEVEKDEKQPEDKKKIAPEKKEQPPEKPQRLEKQPQIDPKKGAFKRTWAKIEKVKADKNERI